MCRSCAWSGNNKREISVKVQREHKCILGILTAPTESCIHTEIRKKENEVTIMPCLRCDYTNRCVFVRWSLPDNEISQHLVILSICLLIIHLVIIASKAVKHEEVAHIGDSDGWKSQRPSSLDQLVAPTTTIQNCAHTHDGGNGGDEGTEACLGLPDAESFMIVEEIWWLLYLVRFTVSQDAPQKQLSLQKSVNFCESAGVLRAEQVADIAIIMVGMGDWSLGIRHFYINICLYY